MQITFTGCSLGDLREIKPSDKPAQGRGLYVMWHPIQSCGRMVSFKANGFCFPAGKCEAFRLQVCMFRREYNCTYTNSSNFMLSVETTHNNRNNSYKCSINKGMDHWVNAGDVVGVQVLNHCRFQPAIWSRDGAVLYSQTNDFDALVTRQNVLLNIQVSIGNCHPALLVIFML